MNRLDATQLALRLLAVLVVLRELAQIPTLLAAVVPYIGSGMPLMVGLPVLAIGLAALIVPLAIAVVLWRKAGALAHRFWDEPAHDDVTPATAEGIRQAIYAGVGVYIMVSAIPALTSALAVTRRQLEYMGFTGQSPFAGAQQNGYLLGLVLQVAVGAALVVGPGRIVGMFRTTEQDDYDDDET
jgi:NADH:ubiquinone oxidoreductase subunit K